MSRSWTFAIIGLCAGLGGLGPACALDEVEPAAPQELTTIPGYRQRMSQVSTPYTSTLPPNPQIELWISSGARTAYDRIRPDARGSNVTLPRGTLIVREVHDGGRVAKLTIMGKGEPGSNPPVGDWWFAVTTPTGEPLLEAGVRLIGKLPQCVACHDERGADDYLFGVTAAAHL